MSPHVTSSHSLLEILPSEWNRLLNLYEGKKTEPTGYNLIHNSIKWINKEPDLDIKCLSLDGDWQNDGTFLMIIGAKPKLVFFNTLSDSLERLIKALHCLKITSEKYMLHDYNERLKPAADAYINEFRVGELKTTQTALYKASKEVISKFSIEPPVGITLRSLDVKDVETINGLWQYGSESSVQFVKRLITYNVSVGAYDPDGKLVAWCLRLPIGALGLLQVLESHRRLGLGKKISELGDEVLSPVVTENTPSRKMFEKLGFQKIDNVYWTG